MTMQYGSIKGLNKAVSRIILGTPALPTEDKSMSYKVLDSMYELGINTFDCAHIYPNDGESLIFQWAKERGIREDLVLISKCAHPNSRRNRVTAYDIQSDISDTLAKKDGDYVDIYMLHRDDPLVSVAVVVETMNELYHQGKIRTYGASNWTYERIRAANDYASKRGLIPLTSVSPNYGLAEQVGDPWGGGCVSITGDHKAEARKYYLETQLPIFSYSPLGRGLFTGRIHSSNEGEAAKLLDDYSRRGYLCGSNIERLRRTEILSKELKISVAQLALAWLFNQPLNGYAIAGTINSKHMMANIEALNTTLSKDQVDWLNLRLEGERLWQK